MFVAQLLVLLASRLCGQTGVFSNTSDYYTIKDCFNPSTFDSSFRSSALPPNRIFKGTRIWRIVDLAHRENKQTLNTSTSCKEPGLLEVLKFGLLELKLHAFDSDDFSDAGRHVLPASKPAQLLLVNDSTLMQVFNSDGSVATSTRSELRVLNENDVKAYLLKEDWVINSYTGKTEKHIVAFAPLVSSAETGKTYPLFWLYFREWSALLKQFETPTAFTFEPVSYFSVFENHYFVSRISKESNVFDRSLKSYRHGAESNLESELTKEKLHNAEYDLFAH